jgi:hypothetical protein
MEPITLTENELNKIVAALLFASSINVVYNDTDSSYFEDLKNLAIRLKEYKPDIKLERVQFIKEETYEDLWSVEILETFKDNIDITTLEKV